MASLQFLLPFYIRCLVCCPITKILLIPTCYRSILNVHLLFDQEKKLKSFEWSPQPNEIREWEFDLQESFGIRLLFLKLIPKKKKSFANLILSSIQKNKKKGTAAMIDWQPRWWKTKSHDHHMSVVEVTKLIVKHHRWTSILSNE